MAAINIHVGTQAPEDRIDSNACAVPSPLGTPRKCVPGISSTHNGLTRMLWIRRGLEDILKTRTVRVADGRSLGLRTQLDPLYFVIDPPFRKNDIPWMPAAVEALGHTAMIGEARKMGCPTWDLPSGALILGGSCPGAMAAQSTVPVQIRAKAAPFIGQPVRLPEAICQVCYAGGGQYASPHVQLGEIIRFWWTRDMLARGFDNLWIETMVRAFRGEAWLPERPISPRTGRPILPVRVHSSGDFFSHRYAAAWVEVANQLPELDFWAPTRTWAYPGWIDFWTAALRKARHGNLIVRPSAYHTGDPAIAPQGRVHTVSGWFGPEQRPEKPWSGPYPFKAKGQPIAGTTAIYRANSDVPDRIQGRPRGISTDGRYDWGCSAYAVETDKATCRNAEAPDGQPGCRVCWTDLGTRVNYTAH